MVFNDNQAAHKGQKQSKGQYAIAESVHFVRIAGDQMGKHHNQGKLCNFRRLKVKGPQLQPPVGVPLVGDKLGKPDRPENGNQRQKEHGDAKNGQS